jgi:hypothetical protein
MVSRYPSNILTAALRASWVPLRVGNRGQPDARATWRARRAGRTDHGGREQFGWRHYTADVSAMWSRSRDWHYSLFRLPIRPNVGAAVTTRLADELMLNAASLFYLIPLGRRGGVFRSLLHLGQGMLPPQHQASTVFAQKAFLPDEGLPIGQPLPARPSKPLRFRTVRSCRAASFSAASFGKKPRRIASMRIFSLLKTLPNLPRPGPTDQPR